MTIKQYIAPFEVELNRMNKPHLYKLKEVMRQIKKAIKFSMVAQMNQTLTLSSILETIEVTITHATPDSENNGHRLTVRLKWTTTYNQVETGECEVTIPCKLEVVIKAD